MTFSIKDFVSKCDQIRSFLRIWWHLLKKALMENLVIYAVKAPSQMFDRVLNTPLHYTIISFCADYFENMYIVSVNWKYWIPVGVSVWVLQKKLALSNSRIKN